MIAIRDERIDGPPSFSLGGGHFVAVDAMASDIARTLAVTSHEDDRPCDEAEWLSAWLEAFAGVEMDLGYEPSHHRYQKARWAAFYGFIKAKPPLCLADKENDRLFGWLVRLLFEECRR